MCNMFVLFFLFKKKTAYEVRISDWSSDVCSSDLARSENQLRMVEWAYKNDIVFAIGPAGTGKTYTAVALAVRALKNKEVKRIILTRPAVEAGENLGFFPGDLKEKIEIGRAHV